MSTARSMGKATGGGRGFSLVEILIAVMILGIGLVMVAGAFPVGLQYFSEAVDRTIAGMVARSMLARLQVGRTMQYGTSVDPSGPSLSTYAQVAVDECFEEGDSAVHYLFDTSGGQHTGAAGRPGALLAGQGMGDDIDAWMVDAERIGDADARFGCQVFYQRIDNPLAGGAGRAPTYQVFVVVQKTPLAGSAGTAWADRFERPTAPTTVAAAGAKVTWPGSSNPVRRGACLVDLVTGDWYVVIEAGGQELTLNRSADGIGSHAVRAINDAVGMYRGVVSKEAIR